MFNFLSAFRNRQKQKAVLSLEEAALLLKTTPEALKAFEESYRLAEIREAEQSNNFFDIDSRTATGMVADKSTESAEEITLEILQKADELTDRIVCELLIISSRKSLPASDMELVSNSEINSLPLQLRPELTGTLCRRDIQEAAYPTVLYYLKNAMHTSNPKEYLLWINHFKQGLDIMDIDPVIYEILGCNQNSIGYWFPALKEAANRQSFFKVPETTIVKVPMPILQLTRLDYMSLHQSTLNIVNRWAYEAFHLDEDKTYFIKTGTYSSKFDFRNAKVTTPKEVRELGSYLLFIHHQAIVMSGPLVQPHPIVGVSTTNEWCVREYIEDQENNPCIYHGMPLHTEYRVFIDCDADEILGIAPYWKPDVMKNRFQKASNAEEKHDYVIYCMHEKTLMERYHQNKDLVLEHVKALLPELHLNGQWSLDIMQNGGDFWLIDMALATNSALSDCVPEKKLKTVRENWIPKLPISTEQD